MSTQDVVIYIAALVANTIILVGTGYAVFVLGASGWWFLLTILCFESIKWGKRPTKD